MRESARLGESETQRRSIDAGKIRNREHEYMPPRNKLHRKMHERHENDFINNEATKIWSWRYLRQLRSFHFLA